MNTEQLDEARDQLAMLDRFRALSIAVARRRALNSRQASIARSRQRRRVTTERGAERVQYTAQSSKARKRAQR